MKLALGTVQFGLPYGVANTDGQVTQDTAERILHRAKEAGVDTIDTAITYGDSEQCLGNVGIKDWRVITKLPKVPKECTNIADWINEQVENSLSRLGVSQIAGLMLHRPNQLLESYGHDLWIAMQTLKDNKIVEKVGFSIYSPAELELLWPDFQPDIIQAPYNIFDQRLKTTGWLQKMHEHGVEVHVRSIFLQGLLLMSKGQRPVKFKKWNDLWSKWDEWLIEQHLSPVEACLRFVASEHMIDYVVVGVDTVRHLEEILISSHDEGIAFQTGVIDDIEMLINPATW